MPSIGIDKYVRIQKEGLTPEDIVTAWKNAGNPMEYDNKYAVSQVNVGRQLRWGFFYNNNLNRGEPREGERFLPVDRNAVVQIETDRVTNCLFLPYNGGEIDFGTMIGPGTKTKTIHIASDTQTCKNLKITLQNKVQKIRSEWEPRLTFTVDGNDLEPGKSHIVNNPNLTVEMKIQISSDETMVVGEYKLSDIIIIEPV